MKEAFEKSYALLFVIAVAVRIAILVIPGNSVTTPWSGGGDMDAYVLLASNLVRGNGYTYAHVPSAWRTPGYPLVIAGMMEAFGVHFAIAVRCLQIVGSLLLAYFCMRTARIWFGEMAGKIALLAALFSPTLLYFSGEMLSECFSAVFVAMFLWMMAEDMSNPRWTTLCAMGLALGLGAMFRPNVAALGAVGILAAWLARRSFRERLGIVLMPLCAALVFSPWIIRNYEVFNRFLITTKSGTDALVGTLNPESRTLPGWEDQMRSTVGYLLPNDVETNSPSRLALGSEIDLNRRCWQATRELLSQMNWGELAYWTLIKWETYWLSTDQLFQPGRISKLNRALHVGAVVFYWVLLGLACCGWWALRKTQPPIAAVLLGYAILVTVIHTPFVMNSRIRAPLVDPLIAILAGGGVAIIANAPKLRTQPFAST